MAVTHDVIPNDEKISGHPLADLPPLSRQNKAEIGAWPRGVAWFGSQDQGEARFDPINPEKNISRQIITQEQVHRRCAAVVVEQGNLRREIRVFGTLAGIPDASRQAKEHTTPDGLREGVNPQNGGGKDGIRT